jgi:acylphosphatase
MQDTGTVEDINMERLHAIVHGDVQGVGFRYFVQRRAQQIGLSGWVRNNDDGTVELVAEGTRTQLEDLRRILEDGPSLARVDRVETKWSEGTGNLGRFELAW